MKSARAEVPLAAERARRAVPAAIGRRAGKPRDGGGMPERERGLWTRYRGGSDPAARAALLELYLGLVRHAAGEAIARLPAAIEFDDLMSAGTLGLVQALEGFDPAQGHAFSTYAMPRIRGAMLDELRRQHPVPRSVRDRRARLAEAADAFERGHGRAPAPHELAEVLGVELATLRRWERSARGREMVSLDSGVRGGGSEDLTLGDVLADERQHDPSVAYEQSRVVDQLRAGVSALAARDRLVLTLSFVECLSLREIGEVLGITESRVCQIRTRALRRLRERLAPPAAAATLTPVRSRARR